MFKQNPTETYIIAEIGQNHNGDINIAKKIIDQIDRYSYDLPEIKLSCYDIYRGDFDAELVNYQSHPTIKAPLSN